MPKMKTAPSRRRSLFMMFVLILVCWSAAGPVLAAGITSQQALVDRARITLDSFVGDPQMAWLKEYLRVAKGVLIIPDLLKAGFFFGGSGGSGVLMVRDEEAGQWNGPAFYIIGSVNWGLQMGAEKAEVIMLVMSPKGIRALLSSNIKLGGSASVALGPLGAGAEGATAPNLNADYLSFSRSKGAYAGLILDGAVTKVHHGANEAYYRENVSPADILVTGRVINPQAAELVRAVTAAGR